MHTTTQQLGRPTNAPTKRTLSFHSCTSCGKKRRSDGSPWEGGFGVVLQVVISHCLLHMDQNVRPGRLPWVWPPGYNHDVGQAQHYTRSLCNNHPFAFIACFLTVGAPSKAVFSLKLHLCVKSLQPQGHKN